MDPRYPIGKYSPPKDITSEMRADAIAIIAASPSEVRAAVKDLTDAQLKHLIATKDGRSGRSFIIWQTAI